MDAPPDGFYYVEPRLERIARDQANLVNCSGSGGDYNRTHYYLGGGVAKPQIDDLNKQVRRVGLYWSYQLMRLEGSREQNSCKVTGLYRVLSADYIPKEGDTRHLGMSNLEVWSEWFVPPDARWRIGSPSKSGSQTPPVLYRLLLVRIEVSGKPEYGHRLAGLAHLPGFLFPDLWKSTQVLEVTRRICEVTRP